MLAGSVPRVAERRASALWDVKRARPSLAVAPRKRWFSRDASAVVGMDGVEGHRLPGGVVKERLSTVLAAGAEKRALRGILAGGPPALIAVERPRVVVADIGEARQARVRGEHALAAQRGELHAIARLVRVREDGARLRGEQLLGRGAVPREIRLGGHEREVDRGAGRRVLIARREESPRDARR